VLGWTDTLRGVLLDVQDDIASFLNVNTQADLVQAEALLAAIEVAP
jgi:molybdopterin-guanine dinucleotide biosynthesis protein A